MSRRRRVWIVEIKRLRLAIGAVPEIPEERWVPVELYHTRESADARARHLRHIDRRVREAFPDMRRVRYRVTRWEEVGRA